MATSITRAPLDFHPKIKAAGISGGLALIAAGVAMILGVPAPEWAAPLWPVIAAVAAGYLKAG